MTDEQAAMWERAINSIEARAKTYDHRSPTTCACRELSAELGMDSVDFYDEKPFELLGITPDEWGWIFCAWWPGGACRTAEEEVFLIRMVLGNHGYDVEEV